mmetsp:Transcript_55993/g.137530  ORF Transcript_55993/g.137530 Transcript_55993/m.137530 type:complete len:161 (+) Transcript_55993:696-1178(+)
MGLIGGGAGACCLLLLLCATCVVIGRIYQKRAREGPKRNLRVGVDLGDELEFDRESYRRGGPGDQWVCRVCGGNYLNQEDLTMHQQRRGHGGGRASTRRSRQSVSGARRSRQKMLGDDLFAANGGGLSATPFTCPVCGANYVTQQDVEIHMAKRHASTPH